jgi:hypothetical protein
VTAQFIPEVYCDNCEDDATSEEAMPIALWRWQLANQDGGPP